MAAPRKYNLTRPLMTYSQIAKAAKTISSPRNEAMMIEVSDLELSVNDDQCLANLIRTRVAAAKLRISNIRWAASKSLDTRIKNVLTRENIETIDDLCKKSADDLGRFINLDRRIGVAAIENTLKSLHLGLVDGSAH